LYREFVPPSQPLAVRAVARTAVWLVIGVCFVLALLRTDLLLTMGTQGFYWRVFLETVALWGVLVVGVGWKTWRVWRTP